MIYARIQNGVVDKIVDANTNSRFVFKFKNIVKTFILWIRIDQLDPQPQVGWKYDKDTGFSNE